MKHIYLLMLSLLSIAGIACAQEKEQPPGPEGTAISEGNPAGSEDRFRREFAINLGKGNRLVLALSDAQSLGAFGNIDSLLQVFMLDMVALKDSMTDPLSTKHIRYATDLSGGKKIEIRQSRPANESFLLRKGVLAALKTGQDTIILSGPVPDPASSYRLSIYLNQLSELPDYVDGRLNEKMREIRANLNGVWRPSRNNWYRLEKDSAVSVKKRGGGHFRVASYIGPNLTLDVQNYKNYFVPSFSLGLAVRLNNGLNTHDIGVYWEPQFLFAQDSLSHHLKTYRNDFITLYYQLGSTDARKNNSSFYFRPFLSIGYLYHREGDYYDAHTWRLGVGKLSIFNARASLQPSLYFQDFFRGVTPGLKLAVRFF